MTQHEEMRAPFAAHTANVDKRLAGRTGPLATQLELRAGDEPIDAQLSGWVYERLGRQLGKFAPQIERVQVRFGDENGPRGAGKCCLIHVILSKLPPVVVEMRGETDREAFDLAAARAERSTRRNLERHGFSTKHKGKARTKVTDGMDMGGGHDHDATDGMEMSGGESEESLFGRHVGHGPDQLMLLAERPEKVRRDLPVDTADQGMSADDRKPGYGHTGKRNTKLNTAGMTHALEDSTTGRPSRKSTRAGTNRIKPDNPLTRRTKAAVQSPKSVAGRFASRSR